METLRVKLDREREIKFTFGALAALARECKINVNDPELFRTPFSPDVLASLVWAGQLHTKQPLSKRQIEGLLPMEWGASLELYASLFQRLLADRGIGGKAEQNAEDQADAPSAD